MSTARVKYDGKDLSVTPGGRIGDFQLIQYTVDTPKKTAKLVFKHPDTGAPMTFEQGTTTLPDLTGPGNEPFKKVYDGIQEGPVAEGGPLESRAYQDPATGDWVIPADEQNWISNWGEKDLWTKLATKPDADAQGVSHGVRVLSMPETGTPLAPSHGITQGDTIRSINGVAMTSKEDIANYLRGPGKGLERYEVVVDTGGSERRIVYRVPRPARVSRD
jgi:hypothetical protein